MIARWAIFAWRAMRLVSLAMVAIDSVNTSPS